MEVNEENGDKNGICAHFLVSVLRRDAAAESGEKIHLGISTL